MGRYAGPVDMAFFTTFLLRQVVARSRVPRQHYQLGLCDFQLEQKLRPIGARICICTCRPRYEFNTKCRPRYKFNTKCRPRYMFNTKFRPRYKFNTKNAGLGTSSIPNAGLGTSWIPNAGLGKSSIPKYNTKCKPRYKFNTKSWYSNTHHISVDGVPPGPTTSKVAW